MLPRSITVSSALLRYMFDIPPEHTRDSLAVRMIRECVNCGHDPNETRTKPEAIPNKIQSKGEENRV